MIKFGKRFDEYAYRVAKLDLDPSVTELEEGQFVTIKGRKLVLANKTDKKAFIATGSHRQGRDQIAGKPIQKVAFLLGTAMLTITNFDTTKVYGDLTPLTVVDGTITTASDGDLVVAHSVAAPVSGELEIIIG